MADPPPEPSPSGTPTSRRPRAPTITIDTTAVNPTQVQDMDRDGSSQAQASHSPVSPEDDGHSLSASHDPLSSSWTSSHRTAVGHRPDIRPSASFESRDSRPTSPHNVSSPIKANEMKQGFLAVPATALRSRQNSIESDDGSRSVLSSQGETVIGTSSSQGDRTAVGTVAGARSYTSESASRSHEIMNDPHALDPDQGREDDFTVTDNPFAFSPGQLNKMFNPKSLAAFWKLGGLAGLERGLRTDRKAGLSVDESALDGMVRFEDATRREDDKLITEGVEAADPPLTPIRSRRGTSASKPRQSGALASFADRKRVYKDNRLPEKKGKSLLQLMWITYNDKVLILLSVAAVVSLAIGLYQTFGQPHNPADGPPVEWVEGVAIIVAILIVVLVGSLNDFQKERQFAKLNKRKQDRLVRAVRSGKTVEISVYDVMAGDVVHLEPGDMIPADGILIEGFNVKCDESQATGESDVIKKKTGDEVLAAIENNDNLAKMDPFIQSGSRVMEGVGTFLVTSTGVYSSYGRIMMSLEEVPEMTPLQSKLNVIAEYIAKLGGAAGLLLFIVLFIMFCVRLPDMTDLTPAEKGQQFLNIFIVVVTIIVVAVPEGLPLAVTLALAFATTRMLKDNNLVRHLRACEVMGNATQICSDKTGTLTQNKMQVVAGTVGTSNRFGDLPGVESHSPDGSAEMTANEAVSLLSPKVKELLLKSIAVNTTAFEGEVEGTRTFIGSKTESALLIFAREQLAMGSVDEERANAKILQLFPFDSSRKCMGVVVQRQNGKARLYVKGASEIMLAKCSHMLRDPTKDDLALVPISEDNRRTLEGLNDAYTSASLRAIGIIYRDFDKWPPPRARRADGDKDEIVFGDVCRNMAFLGLVGIKDPLRPGVLEAVRLCQRAGVTVRMVTGDNKHTAEAIARDCGILQPDSLVMEGPEFRNLDKHQQEEYVPRIHVLARSSPEDKRILVRRLKERGDVVAVTGDGTNDAPALQLADVGFSMGIAGTEVAKEASAIILMDDDFNSIVKALKWGRAVNDAVKRFLQFQLTVNITAVLLTFVSAVSNSSESSVLTAVQLLWVNLIMDTLAALALATDPPQDSVLERRPDRRGASIISTTMWKMILGQALYQLAITFILYYCANDYLPGVSISNDDTQIATLVFNTFVWMQIFNQWNNRRLDNHFNILEGITRNWFFIGINLLMCVGQVLIIMFGGKAFSISSAGQPPVFWAYAIVLGALSIPIGVVIRLIPDSLLENLVPDYLKRKASSKIPGLTVSDDGEGFSSYPPPPSEVRDELAFLKRMKGGRLNNLKFAMQHPRDFMARAKSPSHSREHSRTNSIKAPQTPTREDSYSSLAATPDSRRRSRSMRSRSNSHLGAVAVMSGIVIGSIGAPGWSSPADRNGERETGSFPRPSPRADNDNGQDSGAAQAMVLGESTLTDEPQEIDDHHPSVNVPRLEIPRPPAPKKSNSST